METIGAKKVKVNYGKLLENQLKKWEGGGHHPRGIAEYISNSDDSFRRLEKYSGKEINITIKSRRGKMIDYLIIEDFAEGMSYDDLENKFFYYFESFSGRESGQKVTGRFGTGGKAYAIMNFRRCWIISVKDGKECKSWFKWDGKKQEILNGYDGQGYKDKKVDKENGTTIILEDSYKVRHQLDEFLIHLQKSTRIRHILKTQNVKFRIERKNEIKEIQLIYDAPKETDAIKIWEFDLPDSIPHSKEDNKLVLRYFEKPLGEHSFIDLSDGISSVADLIVSDYDGRPYSKYINGSLSLTILVNSPAVKENRKGLEEYDDLTIEIEDFIKVKIGEVINEIESINRNKEREARINVTNTKLKELSKFLSKQDLKFKLELKELQKRFSQFDTTATSKEETIEQEEKIIEYRKPLPEDSEEILVRGKWVTKEEFEPTSITPVVNPSPSKIPEFIPNPEGNDFAVESGEKKEVSAQEIKKKRKGLQVLMSNDPSNPDNVNFGQHDDPISDRDMDKKGIIWINSVHPIIIKSNENKDNPALFNEHIANFVLIIIAQFYAQKEFEMQPEDERIDSLLLFRKHFFSLQREIREDKEISYFEER